MDRAGIGKSQAFFEVIFVDDGSTDASWTTIETLAKKHPSTKGIRFARNFGKSQALHAGFATSSRRSSLHHGCRFARLSRRTPRHVPTPFEEKLISFPVGRRNAMILFSLKTFHPNSSIGLHVEPLVSICTISTVA